MDLDIKPIRCFVRVAEELSFSKAAEILNVTQPTITSQIRTLEQTIGFSLFTRSTREVKLTLEGAQLLKDAHRLLRESDSFKSSIAAINAVEDNRLKLGAAFYTLDIPVRNLLIETFLEAHPKVQMTVDTSWQSQLLDNLSAGILDVAMVISMPVSRRTYESSKDLQQPTECIYPTTFSSLVIRQEPVQLLIPIESPLAKYETIPRAALSDLKIATLSSQHGYPLVDPIVKLLKDSGALPIVPPEAHGIGVEKYGRKHRLPAISLGWFSTGQESDGMVRRSIQGLNINTELVLLSKRGVQSHGAAMFFRSTRDCLQNILTV